MSILLGLSPFVVFFALMRWASPIAGLIGALIASALLCLRVLRRGESVKILEVGSFVLFGLLTRVWSGNHGNVRSSSVKHRDPIRHRAPGPPRGTAASRPRWLGRRCPTGPPYRRRSLS
jgi:hypothetical protein